MKSHKTHQTTPTTVILTALILLLTCLPTGSVWAQQETRTLEQVIALALANNKALQIQQKQVEIAENNYYPGNANLLPTISLIGSGSYASNSADLAIRTFQENPPVVNLDEDGVSSTTLNLVVQADYVLLGGFSGKYQYKLLQQQKDMQYYRQQLLINQTVLAVSELFLELAKLQSQADLLQRNLQLGEERLQKAEDRFAFGQASGLAVLQAKTTINQDQASLSEVQRAQNGLLRDLNFLIGLPPTDSYRVTVAYAAPVAGTVAELLETVKAGNPEIQLQQTGVEMAQSEWQINQAQKLPTINAFANYGYYQQENDLQQLAEIQTLGYTVGLGLRYNLFGGGRTRKNLQNAQISKEISQLQRTQTEEQVLATAVRERSNLVLLQEQLARDEQNLETFQENYRRTEERFYNGKASSLDLRDAQLALLNAEVAIANLKADLLQTSLRLEAIKGRLLQSP